MQTIKSFGVHIKVKDIEKSFAFYKAFGLKESFAYGSKEFLERFKNNIPTALENYNGISFKIGDSVLEIADGHIAVKPEVFDGQITSSKVSAMFDIESVENLMKLCQDNNIKVSVPPRKFPWGTVEMVIKDPDGFVLVFREVIKSE